MWSSLARVVVGVLVVCPSTSLPSFRRARAIHLAIRGGAKEEDVLLDGNYDFFRRAPEEPPPQQAPAPPPRYDGYREWQRPQAPVIVPLPSGSTGGGVVALIVAMTAALAGGTVWLIKSSASASTNSTRGGPKSVEAMYAETVTSLEAQLHRLSVDRQMLADEFAEARKTLETQISEVTAAAEESKAQADEAKEEADRALSEAKASAAALADRLKAEVALTERLRDEKAKAQLALESTLRHQRKGGGRWYGEEDVDDDDDDDGRDLRFRRRRSYERRPPEPDEDVAPLPPPLPQSEKPVVVAPAPAPAPAPKKKKSLAEKHRETEALVAELKRELELTRKQAARQVENDGGSA